MTNEPAGLGKRRTPPYCIWTMARPSAGIGGGGGAGGAQMFALSLLAAVVVVAVGAFAWSSSSSPPSGSTRSRKTSEEGAGVAGREDDSSSSNWKADKRPSGQGRGGAEKTLRVAFVGNSILYFNDAPRIVEKMLSEWWYASREGGGVVQDSCLRGGATLASLWNRGNGMGEKFATPQAAMRNSDGKEGGSTSFYDVGSPTVEKLLASSRWDYVVMNDHTQSPVRAESKRETKVALRDHYVPLLDECGATPILIQTAAYRVEGARHTEDLGTFEQFSNRLQVGYREYCQYVKSLVEPTSNVAKCRVAPFGQAVRHVRKTNRELWEKLYHTDDFHPSSYGTWLLACVLYVSIAEEAPPPLPPSPDFDVSTWFETLSRYRPAPNQAYPTPHEAMELRRAACYACGVPIGKAETEGDAENGGRLTN